MQETVLDMAVAIVNDMESVRIANANRLRRVEEVGGPLHPLAAHLSATVKSLKESENILVDQLEKVMKQHALAPWIKKTPGLGWKQTARLLGAIGDPTSVGDEDETPRSVSMLWSYCGYSVVDGHAPRRERGSKANWNPDARMRVYLIAESCIKARTSPYRAVYDAGRAKYGTAVHEQECKRCGPKGKPALAGTPLSLGHQHARAMRLVSKAVLKDLWIQTNKAKELAA